MAVKQTAIVITVSDENPDVMMSVWGYTIELIRFLHKTAPCHVEVDLKYSDPDALLVDKDDLIGEGLL